MTYFKCKWNHTFPDEPIMLHSELDDQRWERRKVETFRDGRMGYADLLITRSGGAHGRIFAKQTARVQGLGSLHISQQLERPVSEPEANLFEGRPAKPMKPTR